MSLDLLTVSMVAIDGPDARYTRIFSQGLLERTQSILYNPAEKLDLSTGGVSPRFPEGLMASPREGAFHVLDLLSQIKQSLGVRVLIESTPISWGIRGEVTNDIQREWMFKYPFNHLLTSVIVIPSYMDLHDQSVIDKLPPERRVLFDRTVEHLLRPVPGIQTLIYQFVPENGDE